MLIPSEPIEGYYGINGRSGYDVCVPELCKRSLNELIQPKHATKAIRDFVLKVITGKASVLDNFWQSVSKGIV